MRVIVLAAGQGFQVDGLNKCLIRDPADNRRIIDKIIHAFPHYSITVVVGYQALNVMQEYPQLHYVYNQDWGMTNNSYSLGLALSEEPCYVLSCDLIFEPELIKKLEKEADNIILTQDNENRTLTAINCIVNENNQVTETYLGALRDQRNPEALGIFKISNARTLRSWKQNCLQHRNLFIGLNLPLTQQDAPVYAVDKGSHRFHEINTPIDYMRLIESVKRKVVA